MEKESIIRVDKVTKIFKLPHEKYATVKQHFVNIFNSKAYEKFKALDNVSFEVKKGEFFGIIGSNGSGKSTLLKILAQIYQPTSGKIEIKGSLSPFIELGVGFSPELTARENIFLNAAILGLSKKQTEEKFNEIVEFSELRNFLDQKLKNFSSGMQVRLAFSIAVQAHANTLLIDEVLAVGDTAFQEKCLSVFRKLKGEGKTIIFVSHGLNIMEDFCDRVMYLRNGKVKSIGTVDEVIHTYLRETSEDQEKKEKEFSPNFKKTDAKITDIKFLNKDKKEIKVFETGEEIIARIFYRVKGKLTKPVFGIALYKDDNTHITGPNTKTSDFKIKEVSGEGFLDYKIKNAPFLSGRYLLTAGIFNSTTNSAYDLVDKSVGFRVVSSFSNQFGLLKLDEEWSLNE